MILRLQSVISLFTCSCLISVASSTPTSIGLVMTSGTVQIDGSRVPGSSAIFSGNLISSEDRTANLQYSDGASAVMKPGAKMTVYRERSVLQQGVAMQRRADKHPVIANGLRISGTTSDAVVVVGVKDASYMEVAAQQGEVDVRTSSGNLVARVEPGKTLSFAMHQATGTPQENNLTLCGDLQQNYLITDVQSNVTYQLQGPGLESSLVGKSIKVSGTISGGIPSGSAPQVVTVSTIKKLNHPCVMAAGAAPAATGAIMTKGGIVFLIFVGLGGALIGLGAAGGFGTSPSQPVTPVTP